MELEALGLILRGDSIIDWHRLHLTDEAEARRFLVTQEFRPDEAADRARLESIKNEAIAYLRRHFEFPIPKPVARASVEDLLLLASGRGHRQLCACTILKAMHIIHHLDGRELLYSIPMADQDVFHLVEEKVYRVIGGMLASGFPITEFVGGRKNKDSLYTKLLSKTETTAAAIYDKLRFRIVTRSADDILPSCSTCPSASSRSTTSSRARASTPSSTSGATASTSPHLQEMLPRAAGPRRRRAHRRRQHLQRTELPGHPLRRRSSGAAPAEIMEMAPPAAWALGPIIFVLCEFQIIDRDTEAANELGEASHAEYKDRQKQAVMRRLKLGSGRR